MKSRLYINIDSFTVSEILFYVVVIVLILSSGCVRKIDDETLDQFNARKRAVYSAQVVTGLAGLTDLTEIFVDSQVLDRSSGYSLIDINERALGALDVLRDRLKTGFDGGTIAKVRDAIDDIEKARKAGSIKFKSRKAQEFYFEAIASVEVGLNLIEAVQAGDREPGIRSAGARALQRLQAGADEPQWWNQAIVKATEIARIMVAQGALDIESAWADGDERTAKLHAKNKALLEAWKSN